MCIFPSRVTREPSGTRCGAAAPPSRAQYLRNPSADCRGQKAHVTPFKYLLLAMMAGALADGAYAYAAAPDAPQVLTSAKMDVADGSLARPPHPVTAGGGRRQSMDCRLRPTLTTLGRGQRAHDRADEVPAHGFSRDGTDEYQEDPPGRANRADPPSPASSTLTLGYPATATAAKDRPSAVSNNFLGALFVASLAPGTPPARLLRLAVSIAALPTAAAGGKKIQHSERALGQASQTSHAHACCVE